MILSPFRNPFDVWRLSSAITISCNNSVHSLVQRYTACESVDPFLRSVGILVELPPIIACSTKGTTTGGVAGAALCFFRASAYASSRLLFFGGVLKVGMLPIPCQ
jgi:hypothetical protein